MVKALLEAVSLRTVFIRALKTSRMTSSLSKSHKNLYDKYSNSQEGEQRDGLKVHRKIQVRIHVPYGVLLVLIQAFKVS